MRKIALLGLASALVSVGLAAQPHAAQPQAGRWRGPDGDFLPFSTESEIVDFLRKAEVVKKKEIPQGINKPLKVRLRRDDVEANAIFRIVNVRRARHSSGGEVYLDFHDSYAYECAAFELSLLLGIDNVPPCVPRKLFGNHGTIQLWVEDAMTEEKRRRTKAKAPSSIDWVRQQQEMRIFDGLIFNFDRNQGNMLIDREWKLWFIDHTRSFHQSDKVRKLERIIWCDRGVWEKLQALDREVLDQRIGDFVEAERIKYVLERRDVLVAHLGKRIADYGETAVIYDGSQTAAAEAEGDPDFAAASAGDDIPEKSPPVDDEEGGG